MEQKRFIAALVISTLILFGWSYLAPQSSRKQQQNQAPEASPLPSPAQAPPEVNQEQSPSPPLPGQAPAGQADHQVLTVDTPLYTVKIDNRGAVAVSWIIKKDKITGRPLYSVAGGKNGHAPLELVPPPNLLAAARQAPLGLFTDDENLNAVLNGTNFSIEGTSGSELVLQPGQSQQVEFALRDAASGAEIHKTIKFNAELYSVELKVTAVVRGQPIQNLHLVVGPNIGDQGITHYNFYSVAPEGVAAAGNDVSWINAANVHRNEGGWFTSKRPEGADRQIVSGAASFGGVADTYFAMVAIPPAPAPGLEYRTAMYEYDADGKKQERYLISGLVPITSDGSTVYLYAGPKDHYLLTSAGQEIKREGGPSVDLESIINYGFLRVVSRPLAVPILSSIKYLSNATGSYGLGIILFTIVIYSLFFPLKWRSSKSMRKAQKLAPRMKELQEKIKGMKQNDPRLKELQMEQLRLMKEGNPLGGCLPLLIQMPFLFALYRAITISIDFRQASFLWVPDLSASEPSFIHVLPLLMAASMLVLQLITPQPAADPMQRKMMAFAMPAFMLYMLWSAPAGLLIYWLVGNIVGFAQQYIINLLVKTDDDQQQPPEKKREPPEKNRADSRKMKKLEAARVSQT